MTLPEPSFLACAVLKSARGDTLGPSQFSLGYVHSSAHMHGFLDCQESLLCKTPHRHPIP